MSPQKNFSIVSTNGHSASPDSEPMQKQKQQHAPIAEIAAALDITERGTKMRAAREAWQYIEQPVRGGQRRLYNIDTLPADVREALARRLIDSAPAPALVASHSSAMIAAAPAPAADLTDKQRAVDAARAAFVAEIRRAAGLVGTSKAVRQIAELAAAMQLPASLQALVTVANAKAGARRALSEKTLYRWMKLAKEGGGAGSLAPAPGGRDYRLPDDVAEVLALHRAPNKPSLAWCAHQVAMARGVDEGALYHRADRYRKKLPKSLFYVGRHTGAALNALRPFKRREYKCLAPNAVWVGDGHGVKLKVAHPITGAPFVPEVTAILDVATRYCVGWSVSLSENYIAVADALRHAVSRHGVPLIYYSDNGGGQANKIFDAPITGTLGQLDIHHELGRPGNPQGRGVIERFWQTALIPMARRFDTFRGQGADRETLRRNSIEIDRALKQVKQGQVTALPKRLPTWLQFIDAVTEAIEDYNLNHRHSDLPKLNGAHHATPAEYRAAKLQAAPELLHRPGANELATLFMPAIIRKAARGEVRLFNGIYFHRDLMLVDGEDVQVCYDIHDVQRVWVKRITGELIAEAALGGNRTDYFPEPLIDRLAKQRAARRLGLVDAKRAEILEELHGTTVPLEPVLQPLEMAPEPEPELIELRAGDAARRPLFDSDAHKYRWLLEEPSRVVGEDETWLGWYRTTSEWADLFGDGEGAAAR